MRGGTVSGFRQRRWNTVKQMKAGDILHLTGVDGWIGSPLASEHQKPKRAHGELDRQVEEEDGAWRAAEDSPDGQRVSEEHGPDHCHMPPRRRERGDDAEGHHAEIEAHKSPEDVGLIGAFHHDVHELREGRCRIDAIAQRDRKEEHPCDQ